MWDTSLIYFTFLTIQHFLTLYYIIISGKDKLIFENAEKIAHVKIG